MQSLMHFSSFQVRGEKSSSNNQSSITMPGHHDKSQVKVFCKSRLKPASTPHFENGSDQTFEGNLIKCKGGDTDPTTLLDLMLAISLKTCA